MADLKKFYQEEIVPRMVKEFHLKNKMAAPGLEKVVLNMGLGKRKGEKDFLKRASRDLAKISGQKPKVCRARQSVAGFSLKKGEPIGLKVTLRGQRMYDFLEKLFHLVLPQIKNFQGLKRDSFDQKANYTLGLSEQIIFPEVEYSSEGETRGLEITLVTNTEERKKAAKLLEWLGMPFRRNDQ